MIASIVWSVMVCKMVAKQEHFFLHGRNIIATVFGTYLQPP